MSVSLETSVRNVQSTIIFAKLLGDLQKRKTKKGFICFSFSYKSSIITLLYIALFAVMCIANPVNAATRSRAYFIITIFSTTAILTEIFMFIFSGISLFRWHLYFIAKFDFEISQMDFKLPSEFYRKVQRSTNWILIQILILITTRLILLFTYGIGLLEIVAYFSFSSFGSIIKHLMMLLLLQLRERFDYANNEITSLQSYSTNMIDTERLEMLTQKLYYLNRIHHKLCWIINKLKSLASVFNFLSLLSISISLVILSFRVYLQIFHQDEYLNSDLSYIVAVMWVMTFIYELQSFVTHCVRFNRSANKAPILLHLLRNAISSYNVELDGHIQMYSLQHLQRKVYISALGFFDMDYSLIFSIFGGVTTYLVILVQFDELFVEMSNEASYNFSTSSTQSLNL